MMLRGILEKLISTVSLLVSSAGDFIVTASGDNILIGASPFSDMTGTVTAENIMTGSVTASTISGKVEIENVYGIPLGSTRGTVR